MIHVAVTIFAYPEHPDGASYRVDVAHTTTSDADEPSDTPRRMRQTFTGIQATSTQDAIDQVMDALKRALRAEFPGVIITFDVSPISEA